MATTVQLVAILSPKPGAIEQVLDALTPLAQYVEANEPGALQYQVYKQINSEDGTESVVLIETYKDAAALELHRASEAYAALLKGAAEQQLLIAAPDIKIVSPVAGSALREFSS